MPNPARTPQRRAPNQAFSLEPEKAETNRSSPFASPRPSPSLLFSHTRRAHGARAPSALSGQSWIDWALNMVFARSLAEACSHHLISFPTHLPGPP